MYFHLWQSTANRNWYWTLYAANNRKIGDSAEGYVNKSDCQRMILAIKGGAKDAPIRE